MTDTSTCKYDWIFFDYGGTLTAERDAEPKGEKPVNRTGNALARWFKAIGETAAVSDAAQLEQISAEAHQKTFGSPGQASFRANCEYYNQWIRHIYHAVGIERPVPLAECEAARSFMVWKSLTASNGAVGPRTKQTLSDLQAMGLHLGVISNNSGYVEDLLLNDGVLELFEIVIDSARVEIVKPGRGIFDHAAELAGGAGQRFLYVGDSYEADVVGACGVGWEVAWIAQDHDKAAPMGGVLHKIKSIDELVAICDPVTVK